MEAVRAFNNELSSLYESKPPVSRAKMASVTKGALKAIKFYKHVVQSVEKFIQKCRPEYKVPGLYVIDSIVRQSRHQFGSEKDMFAPRFMKNICFTFQNLFKCPTEEKSKIVRVLNLWQKNAVFPSGVIQPLLDLAADPNNPQQFAKTQQAITPIVTDILAKTGASTKPNEGPQSHGPAVPPQVPQQEKETGAVQNDVLKAVTQLLHQSQQTGATLTRENPQHPPQPQTMTLSAQQQQLQQLQILQQQLIQQSAMLQQPTQMQQPLIDSNLLAQIQALTNQLLQKTQEEAKPPEPTFNKNLLDFDYGESDDEEERKDGHAHPPPHQNNVPGGNPGNVQNLLNDPNIMHRLREMSVTLQRTEQLKSELNFQEERHRVLQQQQQEFDQQIQQPPPGMHHPPPGHPEPHPHQIQPPHAEIIIDHQPVVDITPVMPQEMNQNDDRDISIFRDKGHRPERSRSRSPKRRRRSRSRSRDRDRRRRSRSRERHRREYEREKAEKERQKEKERERRKKGLPSIKERHVSICTCTIWIGHLAKSTVKEDLHAEVSKFGEVVSIHLVPPRGCAFVVMTQRKDASRAIDKLRGTKLLNSTLKTAWAMNKGVKDSPMKDFWDVDLGVTYIPWTQMPPNLEMLAEDGMVDSETLPISVTDPDGDADVIVIGETTLEEEKKKKTQEVVIQPQPPQSQAQHQPPNQPPQSQPQPMMPFPGQPLPGVVPIMPPIGVMPPMMMPGQFPPPMGGIPGMPGSQHMMPGQIPMPRGLPPMMPGGPPGMPQQPPAPVSMQISTPASQGDATPTQSESTDKPQLTPPSSGSNQLVQNIQNIVVSSTGVTPGLMRPATPTSMGMRPGPFGGMPPLNFRLPPPGFDPRQPMMGMPPVGARMMGPQPPMSGPGLLGQPPRPEVPGIPEGRRPLMGDPGAKPTTPERPNERNIEGQGIRMENVDSRGMRIDSSPMMDSPRLRLEGSGGRLERGLENRELRGMDVRMGGPDGQRDSLENRDDRFGPPPMDQRPGLLGGPRMGTPGGMVPRGMPPTNANGPLPGQTPPMMARFPGAMGGPRIQINMPGGRFQSPNGPGGFGGPRPGTPMGSFQIGGRGLPNFQGNGPPGPGGFRPPNLNMPVRIGFNERGGPPPPPLQMSPMKHHEAGPRFGANFPPFGEESDPQRGEFGRFGPRDEDQEPGAGPMRDEFNRFGRGGEMGQEDRFGNRDRRMGDGNRDFRREFEPEMERERERDRRGEDRGFGRDRFGGRDREREERDRGSDRERERERDRDRDRERDRDRDRERDRSRSDRDRDRDRDRPRERERRDRDRERDRGSRRSRWSNVDDTKEEERLLPFLSGATSDNKPADDMPVRLPNDPVRLPNDPVRLPGEVPRLLGELGRQPNDPIRLPGDPPRQPNDPVRLPGEAPVKPVNEPEKPAIEGDTTQSTDMDMDTDMDLESGPENTDSNTLELNVPAEQPPQEKPAKEPQIDNKPSEGNPPAELFPTERQEPVSAPNRANSETPVAQPEPEAEREMERSFEAERERSEPDRSEPEPQPERSEFEPETRREPSPELVSAPLLTSDPEPRASFEPEPEPEPEPQASFEPEPQAGLVPEPEPQASFERQPEPQDMFDPEPAQNAETFSPQNEDRPIDPQPEVQPESVPEKQNVPLLYDQNIFDTDPQPDMQSASNEAQPQDAVDSGHEQFRENSGDSLSNEPLYKEQLEDNTTQFNDNHKDRCSPEVPANALVEAEVADSNEQGEEQSGEKSTPSKATAGDSLDMFADEAAPESQTDEMS